MVHNKQQIIDSYLQFLSRESFPCIAAKIALKKKDVNVMVAGHIACPQHDADILKFMYTFIEKFKNTSSYYSSAAIIFEHPVSSENEFENFMWMRLQALSDLDAQKYDYDERISSDPSSPDFSFSLMKEGFYVIGLHPHSSRSSRQFAYPALVFNPHASFEKLRQTGGYEKMKKLVRENELSVSGSINPMLKDFGEKSEVFQYSGKAYDDSWQCPLKINHGIKHYPATERNSFHPAERPTA